MRAPTLLGSMRHLITVEVPQDLIDASGATHRSFSVYGQAWCHIKPMSLSARFEADRKSGVVTHMFTFRSIAAFSADWRFRLNARVFQVLAFDDGDEHKGFTRAACEEVTP